MTSSDPAHTRRQVAKGTAWAVLLRVAVRSLGLVSTIVLARLLVPSDFGVVALATLVSGALEMMFALGIEAALITDKKASPDHYNTAWTLRVMQGIVMAAALVALAEPMAVFFEEPRIEEPIYWLGLAAFIQGFDNVGTVNFLKHLKYDRDFVFFLVKKTITVAVTISFAIAWQTYWALIAGIVAGKVLSLVLSYVMSSFRPRFSFAEWGDLFEFSKWNMPREFLMFLSDKLDTVFIGKLSSSGTLGVYSMAYEIAFLPVTEFAGPVTRAMLPGLTRLSEDRGEFRRMLVDSITVSLLVALPIAVGLCLVADPLTRVALGNKWLDAIPLLQLLALASVGSVIYSNSTTAFLAVRRPDILARIVFAVFLVRVPAFYWAISTWGAIGAAYCLLGMSLFQAAVRIVLLSWFSLLSFAELSSKVWRSFVAVSVMTASIIVSQQTFLATVHPISDLLASATIGIISYSAASLTLWQMQSRPAGPEQLAFDTVSEFVETKVKPRLLRAPPV